MKRIFTFFVVFVISACFWIIILAEQSDTILFRNIPWYEKESIVNTSIMSISGVDTPWFGAKSENTKIDGWFKKWQYFYTDGAVENGGVTLQYSNVPVAGYLSNLELSFLYPIESGKVLRNTNQSELYMAIYTIENLNDLKGVFNDLKSKLTKNYGTFIDQSYSGGGVEGSLWTGKDGSLVWLSLRQNTISDSYEEVNITYFATNGIERLNELNAQIQKEINEAEEAERDSNATNFDGL